MDMEKLSDLQLLELWEDRRALKNLMGRYVMARLEKQEKNIFTTFWSQTREDVCLGFNHGWYSGQEAVRDYYEALHRGTCFKAAVIKNAFAEKLADKPLESLYGAGPFDDLPASTPLIQVAEDRQTAKGLWYCHGSYADVTVSGPVSYWTWGFYCADFVRENGVWKLWHLCHLNDIETLCGQTWTRPNCPFPPADRFADMEKLTLPKPNIPATLRTRYHGKRPFTPTPRLPEPYTTFSETFSYGIETGGSV